MAVQDSRDQSRRTRTKTTLRVPGKATNKTYTGTGMGDGNGNLASFKIGQDQFATFNADGTGKTVHGQSARVVSSTPGDLPGPVGSYSNVSIEVKEKAADSYRDVFGLKANDKRDLGKGDKSLDGEKVNRKREGRNKLKIALKGSSASSRLKSGTQTPQDKRVGVQGGSRVGTGINIPR